MTYLEKTITGLPVPAVRQIGVRTGAHAGLPILEFAKERTRARPVPTDLKELMDEIRDWLALPLNRHIPEVLRHSEGHARAVAYVWHECRAQPLDRLVGNLSFASSTERAQGLVYGLKGAALSHARLALFLNDLKRIAGGTMQAWPTWEMLQLVKPVAVDVESSSSDDGAAVERGAHPQHASHDDCGQRAKYKLCLLLDTMCAPLPPELPLLRLCGKEVQPDAAYKSFDRRKDGDIRIIQRWVAAFHANKVSVEEMLSEQRTARVVQSRQEAVWLCKSLTNKSLPEIGRRFGGRDHTTVLHAVRKVQQRLESMDPSSEHLRDWEDNLQRLLATGSNAHITRDHAIAWAPIVLARIDKAMCSKQDSDLVHPASELDNTDELKVWCVRQLLPGRYAIDVLAEASDRMPETLEVIYARACKRYHGEPDVRRGLDFLLGVLEHSLIHEPAKRA